MDSTYFAFSCQTIAQCPGMKIEFHQDDGDQNVALLLLSDEAFALPIGYGVRYVCPSGLFYDGTDLGKQYEFAQCNASGVFQMPDTWLACGPCKLLRNVGRVYREYCC